MFRGKKYQDSAKQIDRATLYDTADAMDLLVKTAPAKFDETVELHVKLGVDSRHADQQVRGAIVLPHGTGKVPRVLVFAKGDKADAAKAAGADYVGEADLAQKIQQENWFDFDVVIASPDMMSVVGRLGKLLGPKGVMPSPIQRWLRQPRDSFINTFVDNPGSVGPVDYFLRHKVVFAVAVGDAVLVEDAYHRTGD